MSTFDRRKALGLTAGLAGVGVAAAACQGTSNTGSKIGQNVGNINDLTDQQAALTIEPYNRIFEHVPGCEYPADALKDSLELRNLRKKLLRLNESGKLGYVHLFSYVGLVAVLPVSGKVSSTQSSMTASEGVYSGPSYGTIATVPIPADDISWGPNEGGDQGIFFFTPEDVLCVVGGMHWLYLDTLLPGGEALLVYNRGTAKPSSQAENLAVK